jgi:molybdopterin-guanine dinucleotide biosynthesis protein A
MHCLVLAGGVAGPQDPLYSYTAGGPKALIDVGGRTMLECVVGALHESGQVEEVVIVGVTAEAAARAGARFARPMTHLADNGGLVANILAGVAWFRQHHPETEVILGCSADIPLITGRVVDAFIDACRPWDRAVYYNFVTRQKMEARFPGSRRTYSRLGPIEAAGGDMVIARLAVAEQNRDLLESLAGARKHPWRVARVVGLGLLLKFLLRRVTIADIERTAERILGAPARIILDGPPELAMDADKPFQVDLLRAEFARMAAEPAPTMIDYEQ